LHISRQESPLPSPRQGKETIFQPQIRSRFRQGALALHQAPRGSLFLAAGHRTSVPAKDGAFPRLEAPGQAALAIRAKLAWPRLEALLVNANNRDAVPNDISVEGFCASDETADGRLSRVSLLRLALPPLAKPQKKALTALLDHMLALESPGASIRLL
jgi:hypothetical protein